MSLDAFRAARAEAKRAAVLAAAERAFCVDGYRGVRMDAVARAADVSTATLYSYFGSKERLFAAVVEAAVAGFELEAQGGLKATARAYARLLAKDAVRAIMRLVVAERARFPELGEMLFEHGKAKTYAAFGAAFRTEAAAGRLEPRTDWSLEIGQITGMIGQAVLMPWLIAGREPARDLDLIADAASARFVKE